MTESTGVYVHPSRYPLRVLKRLVPSTSSSNASTSSPSYVRRLDALFRYEAGVEPTSNASSSSKGKGRETASSSSNKSKTKVEPYFGGNKEEELLNAREIFTFESPVEGTVCEWCVEEGMVLADPQRPILRIIEPCKHPVQLGGLCAVCGKDLTSMDYTGFSETSRASISMAHDTSNLTVSLEEAARIENQTISRLRKEKKLSLIVDLDQTVIHATVDPTVGDWMYDQRNPNYDVLQDVQRFRLLNEAGQEEGCWYYVKPRPTLKTFLEEASQMYEMHVYTMGTRAYAENVCRVIDPERKFFANRILSRDESGSMSHKSLQRLFPVDQSMVVVIDDRGDVWDWSPNLVKVVPYDFFVGIGDINSAFLPKVKSALPASIANASSSSSSSFSSANTRASSTPGTPPTQTEQEETAAAINAQNEDLDHQIIDKPLAKMQEEKSAMIHEKHEAAAVAKSNSTSPAASAANSRSPTEEPGTGDNRTDAAKATATPAIPAAKPAVPKPTLSAAKPATTNGSGIGSSRFVSKIKTDDDASDSDSDEEDDEDDEDAKSAVKLATNGQSESSSIQEPQPIPSVSVDDDIQVSPSEAPDTQTSAETDSVMEGTDATAEPASSQIEAEEEAVLHDNDIELDRVLKILSNVHRDYYDASKGTIEGGGVDTIITDIKSQALAGCNIVFSGVFPLDQEPSSSEVWKLALQFGASCSTVLQKHTTHVVAAKSGTSKVHQARRRPTVHIVYPSWLLECVAQWRHEPEEDYLVEMEPGESEMQAMPNTPGTPSFPDSPKPDPPDGKRGGEEIDELDGMDDDGGDESLHVDWGDANAEIEAFLNETDDDDDGMVSGNNTADESDADSIAGGGGIKGRMKRQRSSPLKNSTSMNTTGPTESPLAKRRKVAAARAGNSRLRVSDSIDAIDAGTTVSSSSASQASSTAGRSKDGDGTSDDDDLDDFAKALEGELS